jgi:hypothetical protein
MKTPLIAITLTLSLAIAGCVDLTYELQTAGPATVGAVKVSAEDSWNVMPSGLTPFARKDARVWTHDGPLLDRLMIIPAVPEGEPIFKEPDKAVALPRFKADMLPDELAQFTESSMVKFLGEGDAVVKSSNLKPATFGDKRGITFDLAATPTDGPTYRGMAGAFIVDKRLYLVIFLAAEPYYFQKHEAAARKVISSARI